MNIRKYITSIALRCWLAAAVFLALGTSMAVGEPTITWSNSTGNALWNTIDANWAAPTSSYVEGYNVFFRPPYDTRNPKTIYIGTDSTTPVPVSPGTSQWSSSSYTGGNWLMSGGGIQGAGSLFIGWDANVVFTNYSSDEMTFTGGTVISSGWLAFCPTSPGVYHFGTGPIIASQRGNYVGFIFRPTVAGCTNINDFIVPAAGARWYQTANSGQVLGTIAMYGDLYFATIVGGNRMALDPVVTLFGDRTIFGVGSSLIYGPIDGGGTNTLTIDIPGNTDAWTDYAMYVRDDTNTPVWTIAELTKKNTGNLVFNGYRNLGSNINLRTGAIVFGNLGAVVDLIDDAAAVNLQGGKILFRRDITSSQTETVGSINLQWGHNEIRLSPSNSATYTLASAAPLVRSNYATALAASPNLGGAAGASGAGRMTFPSAPPMIGGGGASGSTTVSIVPFLIGGLTTDHTYVMAGDAGNTLVTYDAVSQSLSNLNTATEFRADIAGSGATDNVRKTTNETLSADASINALVLDASIRKFTIGGPHTLTVNSGAILSRGPNPSSVTVDVSTIDFAGNEGVISVVDAAPSGYGAARLQINSVIQNGGLTKAGYGQLDLYGNSTFTGPFVVNASQTGVRLYGTLATTNIQLYGGATYLQANDRLPPGAAPLVDSRATLYLNGLTQTFANVRSGVSGGGAVNLGATGQLTVNPEAGDTNAFTGSITPGTVIKDGTNIWTVAGVLTPTTLRLQDGILRRTATSSGSPTKTVFAGGMYELAFATRDWTYASARYTFEAGSGGWSARGANITVYPDVNAEWGVTANFVLDDAPLMFNTVYSDGYVRYDRGINLGSTAGTPRFREIRVADNPDSTDDYAWINGVLSGTAADKVLWKTGDGLLRLNSGNTYVGGTKISGGTIQIPSDTGLGAAPGSAVTNVTLDGGGLQFSAAFTVVANRTMAINPGKTAAIDTLTFADTIAGKITGGDGAAGVVKLGSGTLTLSGANDYEGSNTISNGTVVAGSASALGHGSNALDMASTATLDLSGRDLSIGVLTGAAGSLVVNNGAGTTTNTLTVSVATGTAAFDGRINNGATRKVALTKLGSGALALGGTNTYSAPTLVSSGTLLVNGLNSGGGWVTAGTGATLGGTGTVAGSVSVASNATITAATIGTIGTLTIGGGLTLQEGSVFHCDVGGGLADLLVVGGTFSLPTNATLIVNSMGGGWPQSPSPPVLISASALAGATNSAKLAGWDVSVATEGRGEVWISGTNLVFKPLLGSLYLVH